ncbi:MAG: RNA 2',3'-cyclic phosphodiesterase [Beijerinckiaceae bacterium]|nr:RNA 2',3'-cyclic phosphodiesterase [Beijerinckiaceae bacterium]
MPRLFTGLEIPKDIAFRLSLLRGGVSGAKWIEPDDYHLTLSFMGNVDDGIAADAADELSRIEACSVRVRLKGLSSFGGDKPRAIIMLAEPTGDLMSLQGGNDRALRRAGVEPERRKYTPHVTIARLRGASAAAIAAFLGERHIEPIEFTATRFVLYSARTSMGGGPYVIEAAYPLGWAYGSSTESQYR